MSMYISLSFTVVSISLPFTNTKIKGHSFPGDFCGNLRFVGKGTDGVSSVHFLFSSFLAISLATDVC